MIFRFEKGDFSRATNVTKRFTLCNGQLLFTDNQYPLFFSDVFFVKVGAVSGADKYFESEEYGNRDFVCSYTRQTGKTKRMIYNEQSPYLQQFKQELLNRKIKHFDETNWWTWGRNHHVSSEKRIYVNAKTRNTRPFFLHESNDYDGSVLAIFPHNQNIDLQHACNMLNDVNWNELGFVCDGRYLFSQKSLESSPLPATFTDFLRKDLLF